MDVFHDCGQMLYLGEFDHVNRGPALLPLFGFLITVNKIQTAVSIHVCVNMSTFFRPLK